MLGSGEPKLYVLKYQEHSVLATVTLKQSKLHPESEQASLAKRPAYVAGRPLTSCIVGTTSPCAAPSWFMACEWFHLVRDVNIDTCNRCAPTEPCLTRHILLSHQYRAGADVDRSAAPRETDHLCA